eukprot:gnl/MRDRNA2_/MRDRNA2_26931_c0_seq1.p1 gnl/MRDRNA2_/MRDRNA2_26931_c0~~gnl/MRDRNA2_/MRDRNA2_26931_c0_seq1.p1  ORF type:complete len:338 (+),score=33.43 gnl/MRDRNA2_/MRDRNA2_26931_c0_seq1:148-1161(+)
MCNFHTIILMFFAELSHAADLDVLVDELTNKLLIRMLNVRHLYPSLDSRTRRSNLLNTRLPVQKSSRFPLRTSSASQRGQIQKGQAFLPVYSTLDEFLNSSVANRHASHATPIRSIEFDILRALFDEPDEEWTLSVEKPGVKIQHKFTNHSRCILVRGCMEFPGLEPDVVLYNMLDFKAREEWDNTEGFQSVEEGVQGSDVLYFMVPTPPLVRTRDFVVYKRIESERSVKGSGFSVLFRSTSHVSKPLVENCVRGEIYFDGIRMHRANGSKTTQFHVASMSDPGGRLPIDLVNQFVVTKLYQNMQKLREASVNLQAAVSRDSAVRARVHQVTTRYCE